MPPKGTKSPRTKSPKSAKPGAAGSTWESLLAVVSANQVGQGKSICVIYFYLI